MSARDLPGHYPGATATHAHDDRYPSTRHRTARVLVLHTTEGSGTSVPGYNGGKSAPHLTAIPDVANRRIIWHQHYDLRRYARALRDAPGGVTTNVGPGDKGIIQVELAGTSGWASPQNPRAPYDVSFIVPEAPDWYWREVAKLLAWLHTNHAVPLRASHETFPAWNAGAPRMSMAEWEAFEGVTGHFAVPENDHTDPGSVPAGKIVAYARELVGDAPASPPTTPPDRPRIWETPAGTDPTYLHEGHEHPKVAEVQAWATDKWSWARAILGPKGVDGKYGRNTRSLVATLQERLNAQAAREGWAGWTPLDVDGKWGPATERAATTKSGFRKPKKETPVTAPKPPTGDVTTFDFGLALEAFIRTLGYSISCGPTDQRAGRCTPGKHPHGATSLHFGAARGTGTWAIDVNRNPKTGQRVSAHEKALLASLGLLLGDLYPAMREARVLDRGPGDHEDHLHIQSHRLATKREHFRVDLSGTPATWITYGMGSTSLAGGYRRDDVVRLQKALGIKPDGSFRLATWHALRDKQAQLGLTPDGIAGPATLAKIGA